MKYDITRKPTKGAKRTLYAFSYALWESLSEKAFEEISVNEICEKATYPRATFYNYFDDKYDLLAYCFTEIENDLHIKDYKELEKEKVTYVLFDRIYDLLMRNKKRVDAVLKFNGADGLFYSQFSNYFSGVIQNICAESKDKSDYKVPYDMLAKHYSNTLLLVLEYTFIHHRNFGRDEIHSFLEYFLGTIEEKEIPCSI